LALDFRGFSLRLAGSIAEMRQNIMVAGVCDKGGSPHGGQEAKRARGKGPGTRCSPKGMPQGLTPFT
jgi:hypothetical protein